MAQRKNKGQEKVLMKTTNRFEVTAQGRTKVHFMVDIQCVDKSLYASHPNLLHKLKA